DCGAVRKHGRNFFLLHPERRPAGARSRAARELALPSPARQSRGRVPQAHRPRAARLTHCVMTRNVLSPPGFSLRFIHVWRRNQLVWRKLALAAALGNLADPMLYLLGLGYGLGAMLPEVAGLPYVAFLAAGMVCSSTMMSASFEAMYSGFSRMHVQRTWDAIMNAPVTLDDVVLGEAVWAASKSLLSGIAVLVVAGLLGLA